jgi:hypothetical protein
MHEWGYASCPSEQDGKDPGSSRVERATVACALDAGQAPNATDRVERRHPDGLVDV